MKKTKKAKKVRNNKNNSKKRRKNKKSKKSKKKNERTSASKAWSRLREHHPDLRRDDPRVEVLQKRYDWLSHADLTRAAVLPKDFSTARIRSTGNLLRKTVVERLLDQYPRTLGEATHVDDVMAHINRSKLAATIKHIDEVYYNGHYGRVLKKKRLNPKLFVCPRDPSEGGVYAVTEWGGVKPIYLLVWKRTFCEDAHVWDDGCHKRVDGSSCGTPLEFFVGVVAHEMVHVLSGAVLDRPARHDDVFLRYNHYFNGSRPRHYENDATCATCKGCP